MSKLAQTLGVLTIRGARRSRSCSASFLSLVLGVSVAGGCGYDTDSAGNGHTDLKTWVACTVGPIPAGLSLDALYELGKHNLDVINADRAYFQTESDRARSLGWSDELWGVALCHAQDMCTRDFFDHTNPSREEPLDRVEQGTGLTFGEDFWTMGENIAWMMDSRINNNSGTQVFESVVREHHRGYMDECQCHDGCPSGKQAGHRMNILNPDFAEIGIGEWYCARDKSFYNAQSFWRRDPSAARSNPYCRNNFTADPPHPSTLAEK